ncbi:GNAT family N-acetyltransferase [Magnetospira sp. QH-2]|uniref:GNAT family N-acetyltransferase n=1 Tax=Magnetospira sp. (strain QH-2) TaxID=1288970 RepID=UPI0003E8106E|nr:GNAT family N-acetyltransferase [Magnetospira sp. QH-2]CCQ74707.1 putative GCN5-related N-acetyltransferase [Magnetospira sp. QH-2]
MSPIPQLHETVTYLEMTQPPGQWAMPPRPADWNLVRLDQATPAYYRDLQRIIGEPWLWRERLMMDDTTLSAILEKPETELSVLHLSDGLAGMLELDWSRPNEVEIAFLGLAPDRIGQGLGAPLMAEAQERAWSDPRTKRVWLHTCTYDHPGALDFYRAWGFTPYLREENWFEDPRLTGVLPRHAAPHVPLAGSD